MSPSRLYREPLVHFLVAGALIFAWSAWRGEPVDPADRTIEVGREQQALIALDFERTMQRPPTDAELDGLVERWVREEVLYREALRLGLDSGDPVVRRRLAKKMDFLAASQADLAQPSDAELSAWYDANAALFADTATFTFGQRYFAGEAEAAAAMDSGVEGEPSSLPSEITAAPYRDVAARFGSGFASAINGLGEGDRWQGPVQSGLGWHLVRMDKKTVGAAPPLESIRERVVSEWRLAKAEERRGDAYRALADAYTIEIAE